MHIGQLYARDLNVKIGKPVLNEHFVPLTDKKYITIHNSNKVPSKNYTYWPIVVSIIKPELEKRGIKLFQIGTKEDPPIAGVDKFINNTSFYQSFFIIKNSMLHLGIDSCPVHIASAYNVPTVSIYAHTFAGTCSPLWNKKKQSILESKRAGKKPSFSLNENPKTIDEIKPEEIANEVFKRLKFKNYKTQETLFIGNKFNEQIVDIIPNKPIECGLPDDAKCRIRMDLVSNEHMLYNILVVNDKKFEIVTNKKIDSLIINQNKSRIDKIHYIAEEFDEEFLEFLRKSGLTFELTCTKESILSEQRSKFFNFDIVYENLISEAKKAKKENQKSFKDKALKINSSKYYISGKEKSISLNNDLKSLEFWLDIPYYRVYCEL